MEPFPHKSTAGSQCRTCLWLFLSHYCSNSMHSLCQQGAVRNWLPSPPHCIQSRYLEESLPLHQSDPYLKASNLPYISLINFEFPAFITSPLGTSLQIVYYSFIVSSLQHRCYSANSALWRTLQHGYGKAGLTQCVAVYATPPKLQWQNLTFSWEQF